MRRQCSARIAALKSSSKLHQVGSEKEDSPRNNAEQIKKNSLNIQALPMGSQKEAKNFVYFSFYFELYVLLQNLICIVLIEVDVLHLTLRQQ